MDRRGWLPHFTRLGLACMAVAAALCGPGQAEAAEEPTAAEARWYGELDAADRRFRFVLEVDTEQEPDPRWQLRSIDEGDRRFLVEDFSEDGEQLRFTLPVSQASYSGNIGDDGLIKGIWQQRGGRFPLDFEPVGEEPLPPPPEEVWSGTLDAIVQKLQLRFRITRDKAGLRTAWMDSLTQQSGGFRGDLGVKGDTWTIDVPAVRGRFEGTLSADGQTLEGSWSQAGASLALTLRRGKEQPMPAAQTKNRPQTPRPPFPYDVSEIRIRNAVADVTLAGTLTMPSGDGPFPAVVLISGSGPQDRDETLFDHKPFAVLADAFTRRGIAVLRYDDRGVGGSTEGPADATSQDFAGDVRAAWEFLSTQPKIDASRVGLVGHSEGAMLATMTASRLPQVACVVMLAGAGVNGKQVLLSQGRRVLEAEGVSDPDQLSRQRMVQEVLMDTVEEAPPGASTEIIAREAAKRLREQLSGDGAPAEDFDALAEAGVARLSSAWFRFFLDYDPTESLRELSCPVLALIGSRDVQVDAETNLPPLREAVEEAGNPASLVQEMPNLNHLFQTAETGAVSEYDMLEETIAEPLLEQVGAWLSTQLQVEAPED